MNAETLKGHLDLLLLAAIETRPAHGYAIADALRTRSGQTFDLPEGTLYPALHRLERAGLLTSRWSEQTGRRRRIYQLTAKGHRALAKRQSEWTVFALAMNAVIGGEQ
jgi:PadR family transcriptional regulator, regulatory protein PadR